MTDTAPKKPDHGGLRLALDYGPLLVFFGVYKYYAPETSNVIGTLAAIIKSTGAFMVAIVVAAAIARIKLGRISAMMWLTTILVVGFGGLTLWFHDARFIQIKPTIIYVMLSGLLFGGLWLKKPLLKYVFEAGFDGLSEEGWFKLSRNWAWFFAFLALGNEMVRAWVDFDTWLTIKVWGVTALSFLFAMANVPLIMKHTADEGDQSA
jgi:intracellular septation protein